MAARLLANELRRLRMAAGLSQADVGRELGCAAARVGHLETRRNHVRRSDLLVMLQMYKVPVDRQVWYLDLAVKAKEKGWWDGATGIPDWFTALIGLEWGASAIHTFELSLVPGLLQSQAYMEALFRNHSTRTDEQVQGLIEQRLRRQEVLERAAPPALHAVLDEGCLRRKVGDREVMREQLTHLVELNAISQITLQVLPFERGSVAGTESGFHLIEFAVANDPGVVYLETQLGGLFLEEDSEVDSYTSSFDELRRNALTPRESSEMIENIVKELR